MPDDVFSTRFIVNGGDFANGGKVSTTIKAILEQIGISPEIIRKVVIASYEAEMNVVLYAKKCEVTFIVNPREIRMIFDDEGPGIEDIEKAMQEGYSTASDAIREMGFGAGMGLPNIKKNTTKLEIKSEVNKGTRLEFLVSLGES